MKKKERGRKKSGREENLCPPRTAGLKISPHLPHKKEKKRKKEKEEREEGDTGRRDRAELNPARPSRVLLQKKGKRKGRGKGVEGSGAEED